MKHQHICCIVGHQPANLPFGGSETDDRCLRLKQRLRTAIIRELSKGGVIHFLCSMHIGAELYAAEIIEELQTQREENILLTAVLPYEL